MKTIFMFGNNANYTKDANVTYQRRSSYFHRKFKVERQKRGRVGYESCSYPTFKSMDDDLYLQANFLSSRALHTIPGSSPVCALDWVRKGFHRIIILLQVPNSFEHYFFLILT